MSITNGYCTLAQLRDMLTKTRTYTATTISFASSTKKIADTRLGLRLFPTGNIIQVAGSTSNDGFYTIATGGVNAEIVTSEVLTDEVAGDSVTITDITDPIDDTRLELIVTAASRAIDKELGRRFYTTAEDETRYFTALNKDVVYPWDVLSITTLAVDDDGDLTWGQTWATSDYNLEPFNASLDTEPYTAIRVAIGGDYSFVTHEKGVKIVGKFGYCTTTPDMIREACLLLSMQLFQRKDAIYGQIGTPDGESLFRLAGNVIWGDPHLRMLLSFYQRRRAVT